MRFRHAFYLLLPLAVACGQAAPANQARTIVCFGDSLTAGYGAPQGDSYPDFLRADLIARGLKPKVVNKGVDGDTTKGALTRVGEVVALHPDLVILEIGGNDGLRGVPPATIEMQLASIIQQLRAVHAQVLLAAMTLPPNYGPDYVAKFTAIYPALAQRYRVKLLPMPIKDVFETPERMTGDGIHPNASGYEVMAHDFLPFVLPLLGAS